MPTTSPTTPHICAPNETVPATLRSHLRWDGRHDEMATKVMRKFRLVLPRDRELIRQLTLVCVQQGSPP